MPRENRHAISLRDGTVTLDGVQMLEASKMTVRYKPEVKDYKSLRDKGKNRRWVGRDIEVTIEEYRSTSWLLDVMKEYEENGTTPEFKIQGQREDKDSDYYDVVGIETVTCTGCVITSDIPVFDLDTGGDFVKDSITFGAKNMQGGSKKGA